MSDVKHIRAFIASPGGLTDERNAFKEVVRRFSDDEALERGYYFQPVGWEETLGGFGRPQELINQDLQKCNVFFLVLYNWWGTPPSAVDTKYSSGTEEEFHVAVECYNDAGRPMQYLILLFKQLLESESADPGPQLSKVLAFKKERETKKDLLYTTYDSLDSFERIVTKHLSKYLRIMESTSSKPASEGRPSIDPTFHGNDMDWIKALMVHDTWDKAYEKAASLVRDGKLIEAELIFGQIASRSSNPRLVAGYAKFLRKQGRTAKAREIAEKAIELARNRPTTEDLVYCQRQLGRILEYMNDHAGALRVLLEAKEGYEALSDTPNMARVLRDIAYVQNKLQKTESALMSIERSIELYRKADLPLEQSSSLGFLGIILKDSGDLDRALEAQNESLRLQLEHGNDKEALAMIYGNLGVVQRMRGGLDKAAENHMKALETFKILNDKRGISREYSNLGVIERKRKNFDQSINLHRLALEIAEETMNQQGQQIQFSNLGMNYLELGMMDLAESYFLKAYDIALRLSDRKGMSFQHKYLSDLYLKKGDVKAAIHHVQKAYEMDKMARNRLGEMLCERQWGKVLLAMGEVPEAIERLMRARKGLLELDMQDDLRIADELLAEADRMKSTT